MDSEALAEYIESGAQTKSQSVGDLKVKFFHEEKKETKKNRRKKRQKKKTDEDEGIAADEQTVDSQRSTFDSDKEVAEFECKLQRVEVRTPKLKPNISEEWVRYLKQLLGK